MMKVYHIIKTHTFLSVSEKATKPFYTEKFDASFMPERPHI